MKATLLTVAVCVACLSSLSSAMFCGLELTNNGTSYNWDLSSLSRPDLDYNAIDADPRAAAQGQTYFWNFCTGVTANPQCAGSGVCQKATNGFKSCGALSTMEIKPLSLSWWPTGKMVSPTDGVTVTYSGGTPYGSGVSRKTDIHVLCDESARFPTILYNHVEESSGVGFTIFMTSAAACPSVVPPPTPSSCSIATMIGGVKYNWTLSPLSRPNNDYSAFDANPQAAAAGQMYFWNFCTGVTINPQCTGSGVCQKVVNGFKSCGALSTMEIKPLTLSSWPTGKSVGPTDGVTVTYSGGTPYGSGASRKTDIHVLCDKAAWLPTIVNNNVYEASGVGYTIFMTSVAGCPWSW